MKLLLLLAIAPFLLQAQADPAAFAGLTVPPYPYEVANYVSEYNSDALRIFPAERDAITIALPSRLSWPTFGPDGKSLYGIVVSHPKGVAGDQSGLSKIEFNPTRVSPVPGTEGFSIRSFAVSSRLDKIVISGQYRRAAAVFLKFCFLTAMSGRC